MHSGLLFILISIHKIISKFYKIPCIIFLYFILFRHVFHINICKMFTVDTYTSTYTILCKQISVKFCFFFFPCSSILFPWVLIEHTDLFLLNKCLLKKLYLIEKQNNISTNRQIKRDFMKLFY